MIKDSYTYHLPSEFRQKSDKLAGFDLDSTIIKTKSGRKFPKDKTDWVFLNEYVVPVLHRLYNEESYNIVIFTNQSGLKRKPEKQRDFLWKLKKVIEAIGVPVGYYVSINHDQYRKPMTGMFYSLCGTSDGEGVDGSSFYCRDAAGRPGDFSSSDFFFAVNCHLPFYVPEDIFHDGPIKHSCRLSLPERPFLDYLKEPQPPTNFRDLNQLLKFEDNKKYMIVMVGSPASGKSHLTRQLVEHHHEQKFHIVSQDQVGTHKKMENLLRKCLEKGNNIIVDNTNPAFQKKPRVTFREFYFKVMNDIDPSYVTIAINMTTSPEIIHQLNHFRAQHFNRPFINRIVYNVFNKYYEPPTTDEGFDMVFDYESQPVFTSDELQSFMCYY
jgi:bifunctional polynucleotide phosphatase/kinase